MSMTPAEFQLCREHYQLTVADLARYIGVSTKSVCNWEAGRHPVPASAELALRRIVRTSDLLCSALYEVFVRESSPVMVTYRSDADVRMALPGTVYPASWHRAIAAQVKWQLPDLSVVFWDGHTPSDHVWIIHRERIDHG